ncbi:hypothetical protein [Rickettsia fournieri]|uniref:hypothetical protein n=1 Tax=Rickettsia fournieri TaxID=1436798 RepID=UPI001FD808AC|nr:hypothetical protein [Rickettsia fournieri]
MVIIHKIEPLSFWGPFFAFITANCGAILRDFIMKENSIKRIPRGVSIEITVFMGYSF